MGALDFPGDKPAVFSFHVMIVAGLDVPWAARTFTQSLAQGVVAALRGAEWSSKLDSLALHPILLDPSIGEQADDARHSRNGNATISVKLDFASWTRSPAEEQLRLIAQCIAWGIRRIAPSHLGDADRARTLDAVKDVTTRLLGRPFIDDETSGPVTAPPPPKAKPPLLKL